MLEPRTLGERNLGNRVGPVHAALGRHVALQHGGAGAALHDHERARMRYQRLPLPIRRDREHDLDRPLQLDPGRHVDEGPVGEERRVEGRERARLIVGVTRQMPLRQLGVARERCAQAPRTHAPRELGRGGERGSERAVHEDQADGPRPGYPVRRQRARGHARRVAPVTQRERGLGDGSHAREPPLFLLRRGKSQLGESRDRLPTEVAQPRRRPCRAVARERLEQGKVVFPGVHGRRHPTAASSRSQSYPFSSSSRASSLVPDFTIRPPERTCTKSGVMCVRIR